MESTSDIVRIKIALDAVKPAVMRRIEVPVDQAPALARTENAVGITVLSRNQLILLRFLRLFYTHTKITAV